MRMLPIRNPKSTDIGAFVGPIEHRDAYCGHRLDIHRPPHSNCEQCWAFFFISNHEFTRSMAELYTKDGGEKAIANVHGSKLVKKLKWFFVELGKAKEQDADIAKMVEEGLLQDVRQDLQYDVVIPRGATTTVDSLENLIDEGANKEVAS